MEELSEKKYIAKFLKDTIEDDLEKEASFFLLDRRYCRKMYKKVIAYMKKHGLSSKEMRLVRSFHDTSGKPFKIKIRVMGHFFCMSIFCIGFISVLDGITGISILNIVEMPEYEKTVVSQFEF